MDKRRETLSELHTYVEGVDKEITMILQSLQWDRKHLLEGRALVSCMYDPNHRVPPDKKAAHERDCVVGREGYPSDDEFLPEVLDETAATVVRLSNEDIKRIINTAAAADSSFVKGLALPARAPLTAGRLLATLTVDERRAVHDAVVAAAPDLYHSDELALPGSASDEGKPRAKSKLQVLAELRDMRRRRAKYRGAAPTTDNYSHVLRDVIRTQMELFTGVVVKDEPQDSHKNGNKHQLIEQKHTRDYGRDDRRGKHRDHHYTDEYEHRSSSRDYKDHDRYREKHRSTEDKERIRYREKHDDETRIKYDNKIPNKQESDFDKDNETGRSSSQNKDRESGYSDKFKSRKYDKNDSKIKRGNYKSDKSYDSSTSRSTKSYRDDYYKNKHDDPRSSKRYWDRDDEYNYKKSHEAKRKDEYSYDMKRKKYS